MHWEDVRELFAAKWVEELDDEGMMKKMADLTQAMDPLQMKSATLNMFSITMEEQPSNQAQHTLKKLFNNILDRLDDEQVPATLQDLNNDVFVRGFQAGYREAYKQWGEEVEERLDEAYKGGIVDKCKQWKGKQTSTETTDGSTQTTTITIETAVQTNAAPDRHCAGLQMEPPENEELTTLKNAGVNFNTQATPQTTEMATQTSVEPPSTCPNAATSPLAMAPQPPSMTPTLLTTTSTTLSPAPKPPETTAHTAKSSYSTTRDSPAPRSAA